MANNKSKNQQSVENKKGNAATEKPQGSKTQATKVIEKPVPTVEAEEVDTPITGPTTQSTTNSLHLSPDKIKNLSPDSKVTLANLAQERYMRNPDAPIKYGQKFLDEVDNLIDATVMMAFLDLREEAITKGVDIGITFKNGMQAFQMTEACKLLGINVSEPKLIGDGQTKLDFKDATLDANLQNAVDNEKKARKAIEEVIPELDPSKMTTDEELKSALEYQMRSTQNGIKSLFNTIVWLRSYKEFKAQTPEEKKTYAELTTGQWTEEILNNIKPTLLLTGIGRAIYVSAAQDGTPITAHCTVRKNVLDTNGKPILTEEQIADLVYTLLKANAKFSLAKEPEAMKDKSILDDKALLNVVSGNESMIERIMAKNDDLDKKIYSIVLKQYYPTPSGDMTAKVRTKIGQLMNLYLPIAERMEAYPEITEEQDYPAEEPAPTEEEKKN